MMFRILRRPRNYISSSCNSSSSYATSVNSQTHSKYISIPKARQDVVEDIASILAAAPGRNPQTETASEPIPVPDSNLSVTDLRKAQLIDIAMKRIIDPLAVDDAFDTKAMVSIGDLFKARVHLGHKEGVQDPHFWPFVYGTRINFHVIDLNKTLPRLHLALNFAGHMAYRGAIILFLCQNRQHEHEVVKCALSCREFVYTKPFWKPGTFTYPNLLEKLPQLLILLGLQGDTAIEPSLALTEAFKMTIPTIGVCDSNFDPRSVTYCIPGNDDSPTAIKLYCQLFAEVVNKAKALQSEHCRILLARDTLWKNFSHQEDWQSIDSPPKPNHQTKISDKPNYPVICN